MKSKPMIAVGMAFCFVLSCKANVLETAFANPPASARPWVYWFALDGNITSNGITADLESMARVGIGGVLYMETAQGTPKGPVPFASEAWFALMEHACNEAARLGLQINMNNDAGWCGSGGPWITPEQSMQRVVWSETNVTGSAHFDGKLQQPPTKRDFYRDIAVLAFRTPKSEKIRMRDAAPKVTMNGREQDASAVADGQASTAVQLALPTPKEPVFLQFQFAKPFTARLLTLVVPGPFWKSYRGRIEASDDGQNFRTVDSFSMEFGDVTRTLTFAPVSASVFRVYFTDVDPEIKQLKINEAEFSPQLGIGNLAGKTFVNRDGDYRPDTVTAASPEDRVPGDAIMDLTARMKADPSAGPGPLNHLTWEVPKGDWTILRFGYTTTGAQNAPAPDSGRGLECDKLSQAAVETHFNNLMGKLVGDNRALSGPGKTLVRTHIDSWEVGSQNWTPRFREEFRRLRGYELTRFLPVFSGRIVDSPEITERFLRDLRQTIADLLTENYAGHMQNLARRNGLGLSIEAYGNGPFDDLVFAGRADEPMAEFWSWSRFGSAETCTAMASATHVYGKPILGAEAFTAVDSEKWLGHPANIKDIGDWAFCEGVNRFVFHRYALQPWKDVRPGVGMGPWGLHYERTQTWWEQSRAWHTYLSRCQYLLQQGLFVADLCFLTPETVPQTFRSPMKGSHDRAGYNFDGCPSEVVLTRMTVKDGRILLPDGMSYRMLVLPLTQAMTPQLLRKIRELVEAGATVLGNPPTRSPSLAGYPQCDADVRRIAQELWGDGPAPAELTERALGRGRVIWGRDLSPKEGAVDTTLDIAVASRALARLGVQPDFACRSGDDTTGLRSIHKRIGDADVYFVANKDALCREFLCSFRVQGRRPELWWPDTGRIEPAVVFEQADGGTRVPIRFDPVGSVFVVFRQPVAGFDPVASVTRNGEPLLPVPPPPTNVAVQKAVYGILDESACTRDVTAKVQDLLAKKTMSFRVTDMARGDDPAFGRVKTLRIDYMADGESFSVSNTDGQTLSLNPPAPKTATALHSEADGSVMIETSQSGHYVLKTASGKTLTADVPAPLASLELDTGWAVEFPPKSGAPERVMLPKLISWSEHPDNGVRYFSGTATYRKTIEVPEAMLGESRRIYLDLGKVAIMAEVTLNGKAFDVLWKEPFSLDVTRAVRSGTNMLEVKVVNLWINRMIGDEQLPDDSPRNKDGRTVAAWPEWLLNGQPSPTGRFTFTSHRLWKKDDPLVTSGLLGPVTLRTAERIQIQSLGSLRK
jgi:hypothetical protein